MTPEGLTDSLGETLALFEGSTAPLTTTEVAELLDLGRRSTYERLRRLADRGLVDTKAVGASGRVWWRAGEVPAAEAGHDWSAVAESLISDVLDTAPVGAFVLDEGLEVVWMNDTAEEYFGLERSFAVGRDKRELVREHVAPAVADSESFADRVLTTYDGGGATERFECRVTPTEARAERWLEHRSEPIECGACAGGRVELYYDITDRKDSERYLREERDRLERDRRLRDRIDQQEGVADLGQRALAGDDPDTLMAEAASLISETLDTDYTKMLDLDAEAGEFLLRQGAGWDDGTVGEATVSSVAGDSQAAQTLATDEPVVVEDLSAEERFAGPPLLTDHGVRSGISTIIGTAEEPWGILGTHDTAPREFADQDVTFVQSVANVLATAIDRHERERTLIHQRRQLAAMNSLHATVRRITEAIIERSTREEIEATVCEHLAATDSYEFAWIGEVDPLTRTVECRVEAGVEGYLDDITISTDPDDERSSGATGRALRTGRVETTSDLARDSRYEPWRGQIDEYEVRSSAAIPIVHEGSTYGALNVYADRCGAFEGTEREVLAQLGEIVGHAIAASERKQALMSDDVVELDVHVPDFFPSVPADERPLTVRFDHGIPLGDGEFLVYGTASAETAEVMETLREATPHWTGLAVRGPPEDGRFEVRLSEPPILATVASAGGAFRRGLLRDGDLHMRVHIPTGVDVRRLIASVREEYPDAQLLKRRQITRPGEGTVGSGRPTARLTERQATTLEAAYHAGYFEWPRTASGEEVADSLGIASSTFHQHLRKAEAGVMEAVLSQSVAPLE
jgi:GAF domain-containing protein/PAS domain-containing protein